MATKPSEPIFAFGKPQTEEGYSGQYSTEHIPQKGLLLYINAEDYDAETLISSEFMPLLKVNVLDSEED